MEPKPLPGGRSFEFQVPGYQPPPGPPPGYPPGYPPGLPPGYGPPFPPGYPGAFGPPAPKSSNSAAVIVVIVVVVVALLLMIPVLYVLVAGLGPGTTSTSPTAVLAPGSWSSGNLSVSVTSVSNAGNLNSTDLTYVVSNAGGTTYYTGAAGLNITTLGTLVNVRYQDNLDAGHVSVGDSIIISVFPTGPNAVSGGSLMVFWQDRQIGRVSLP